MSGLVFIQRIQQAIADDTNLAENSEYQAAKTEQERNEARIGELEDKLARAEIINVAKLSGDTIKFGATVTLIGTGLPPPAFRLPLGLTDSFTIGDVEPPNEAEFVGVNTAVSGNVPAAGNEVVVVAVPVASTAIGVALIAVAPFMNVTVPAG